jgi:molybdopterin/thiamine biosynthesis adenylyltransferase
MRYFANLIEHHPNLFSMTTVGLPKHRVWGESPFDRQQRVKGFRQDKLREASVWLFGVNGLGRTLAEVLVRKGYGCIGLADDDEVELTNLHRTFWRHEAVGEPKVIQAIVELSKIALTRVEILGYYGRLEDVVASPDLIDGVSACLIGIDNDRGRAVAALELYQKRIPAIFYSLSSDTYTYEVFIQQPGGPCWACLYPERYEQGIKERVPAACPKIPSIADPCLVAVGLTSYALDSLLMDRPRYWNHRKGHLHGEIPETVRLAERFVDCPICGNGGVL